jgi:hypothetical protein
VKRARRWTPALAVIAAPLFFLLLAGCPLSSDKPLSDPRSAAVDPALIGTWKTQDPESGEWNRLTILAFDEHEMVGLAPEDESPEVTAFRLFVTPMGTQRFLNVQELGDDQREWFFARYEIARDRMRLTIVDEALFEARTFASSAELRDHLRAHLSDPRLYAAEGETVMESTWERVSPAP